MLKSPKSALKQLSSNFYPNYQARTVRSFTTYVSDNPERSGIHNYYLMTAVEQGIPGLLVYLDQIKQSAFLAEWHAAMTQP